MYQKMIHYQFNTEIMSKLSMEQLKSEMKQWLQLKKALDRTPSGKVTGFGKLMSVKYDLQDKKLEEEIDHNIALLHLMSKHVTKEESV
tara:strand:- start:1159 stop:1422 length:264 start_codon:yes stop_codon:yes gene_type:complete